MRFKKGRNSSRSKQILSLIFDSAIRTRAIKLALVVGPILTLINQYDVLFGAGITHLNWLKVGLTFFMPYAVSTYSAVKSKLD